MKCKGIFLTVPESGATIEIGVARMVGRELCMCGRFFLYFKS